MILQPTLILTYLDSSPMVPTGSHLAKLRYDSHRPSSSATAAIGEPARLSCVLPYAPVPGWESKTKHPNGGNIVLNYQGIFDSLYPLFVFCCAIISLLIIVDSKSPMPGWLCIKLLLVTPAAKSSHAVVSIHINTPCVFWLPRTYDGSTSLLLAINSRLL